MIKRLRRALVDGIRSAPGPARELALALLTRSGARPVVLPGPPPGPVLVVAPHPDDELLGPGGAVARHLDRGDVVTVLLLTSGGATGGGGPGVTAAREEESRRALAVLAGPAPARAAVTYARLRDGGLPDQLDEAAAAVAEAATGAATVYVPSPLDPHPDHRAAAVAVGMAITDPAVTVHGYEVWGAGPVDVLLDVTDVFARKQAGLAEYAIALQTVDYVRTFSGLAAYRSASGGLGGRGFAEGFLRATAEQWASLTADLPLVGSHAGGGAATESAS